MTPWNIQGEDKHLEISRKKTIRDHLAQYLPLTCRQLKFREGQCCAHYTVSRGRTKASDTWSLGPFLHSQSNALYVVPMPSYSNMAHLSRYNWFLNISMMPFLFTLQPQPILLKLESTALFSVFPKNLEGPFMLCLLLNSPKAGTMSHSSVPRVVCAQQYKYSMWTAL